MKFKNKNIYIADLNKAKHYRGRDTDFEYATYDTDLVLKDCIIINVASDLYVPLVYFNNLLSYLSIKLAIKTGKYESEDRFVSKRPNANTKELYFLTDIRKLNFGKEKVSLKELKSAQHDIDYGNEIPNYLETTNITNIDN